MAGSGRPKASRSKHNQGVLKEAKELKRRKYSVYADIEGYKKPPRRGRFIPDIIAKKGNEEIIIEVETTDSANSPRDLAQQEAFRQAAKKSGAKFRRKIV